MVRPPISKRDALLAGVLLAAFAAATGAAGQGGDISAIAEPLYRTLEFRGIGPAVMGGRMSDVEAVETDPRIIYAGASSGGVWKTIDGGTTWTPIFDDTNVSAIGDVAIARSNPNVVWVGTGDKSNYASSGWGDGVYRSLDAGATWTHMGLEDTHHIGRIAIDPGNPDRVFVAAIGHAWGPNRTRGVFRTEDAGKTWAHVLQFDERTGAGDLAMAPDDPRTLYAAAYRPSGAGAPRPAAPPPAGEAAGLYKTTDGGDTWQRLGGALPTGRLGRVAVDVCRANPSVVYTVIGGHGVFRSNDRGATWTRTSRQDSNRFGQIRVDPTNCERVWIANADPLFYSEDGGRTFCASEDGRPGTYCANWLERIHFDTHGLWIDPRDADRMIVATDGGLYLSNSRGRTWDYVQHLPLAQFYQIGFDMEEPYHVYGGMQDTGTWSGPSRSLWMMGITNEDWFGVLVGDGYYVTVDPTDPDTIYAEYQGGRFFRVNRRTWERRDIRPLEPKGEEPYRVLGANHPLVLSPHDPKTVYVGGNRLFTSTDRGDTWTATAELTAGDGAITSIAESPVTRGVLWIGTDDGQVQVSQDAGASWRNVTAAIGSAPPGTSVSRVVASAAAAHTAYVTFNGHWLNDFTPYVFRTTDAGATWQSLRANLPDGLVVKVIREHPRNPRLLFLGTEAGLYVSFDAGTRWLPLRNNLPPARIDDLQIHPRENDLIVGTHGRGFYILDDLTPLERLADATRARDVHLFDIRPATMWRLYNHRTNLGPGHRVFIGPNPPYGALISYYVKPGAAQGGARITIVDRQGALVRELTGPAEPGLNRIAWDLKYGTPLRPPADLKPDPPGQPGGPRMRVLALSQGPLVLPGTYTVKLSVGGTEASTELQVREDPRLQVTGAELTAHREAWHQVTRLYLTSNAMFNRLLDLRESVRRWQTEATPRGKRALAVKGRVDGVAARLDALAPRVAVARDYGPEVLGYVDPGTGFGTALTNRAGQLLLTVANYTGRPTPRQERFIAELVDEFETLRGELNALIEREIPTIDRQARRVRLPGLQAGASVPALGEPTRPGTAGRTQSADASPVGR